MITIPEDASPADVVGETTVLPGQDWLSRSRVLDFAQAMASGAFDWETSQQSEPMSFQEGSNGRIINQGHHRWLAARLAGVEIPVTIEIRRDYWPGVVPFAKSWKELIWLD